MSNTDDIVSTATTGTVEDVRYFIEEKKVNVNAKDYGGRTALHEAARYGNIEVVKFLVTKGADIHITDPQGFTALHHVAMSAGDNVDERIETAKYLISQGADVEAKTNEGNTPVDLAKDSGCEAMVEYLTNVIVDIFDAASKGTVEDMKYFIEEKGINVNTKNKYGTTPLHIAASFSNVEVVKFLISKGADVGICDEYGKTPLLLASAQSSLEIVQLLVSHGANVNAKDSLHQTPLHCAAECNDVEVVKYLISKGADVNAKNSGLFGKTALKLAETEEKKRVLREAMQKK